MQVIVYAGGQENRVMASSSFSTTEMRGKVSTHRIVLDSRDRDRSAFPDPAKYEVKLPDDLDNVISVRLVSADVPFSAYTLPADSPSPPPPFGASVSPKRSVMIQFPPAAGVNGGLPVPITLPAGNYASAQDIAQELNAAMQAASVPCDARFDPRQDVIYIFSDYVIQVQIDAKVSPRLAALLGAGAGALTADAVTASSAPGAALNTNSRVFGLRMPYRVDVRGDRYVSLTLSPSAELLRSANTITDRTFAIVPSTGQTNISGSDGAAPVEKSWRAPLARVARIGLQFLDYYGEPYDFQNQDHRIELVFRCLATRAGSDADGGSAAASGQMNGSGDWTPPPFRPTPPPVAPPSLHLPPQHQHCGHSSHLRPAPRYQGTGAREWWMSGS